jgi:DNA-binding LacI/PurR family transcriptional regulator
LPLCCFGVLEEEMMEKLEGAAPDSSDGEPLPRHRQIYQDLLREIQTGVYQPGDRFPSEAALSERFGASRITVAKAIQQLQRERLVSRIAGSGTYVDAPARTPSFQFGLLIPELGSTEIFEPICQGMMKSPLAKTHSLIWGHFAADEVHRVEAAEQLCRQYIAQKVSGVFFAPIEYMGSRDHVNRDIVSALSRARIPVVLLDRCFERYPDRAPYDLIGIDNHRAGYVMTRHLVQAGATRIAFAARPDSASTVDARIAGYREALHAHRKEALGSTVYRGDFSSVEFVGKILDEASPDAFLCANDATAAKLMLTLGKLGVTVPKQVRMVGIDDVAYAKFLPVPLTTLHQNCYQMGSVALSTMLDRLKTPDAPPRDILLPCDLVVRESCGAHLGVSNLKP